MKVFALEEFRLAVFQPLGTGQRLALGAMPIAAGIVGNPLMMARFAALHMAAQCHRAAARDGTHHAVMHGCKPTRVRTLVGHAVLAEDIRHLESGSHRRRPTQKYVGAGRSSGSGTGGKRSKGLRVAHTVWVATFK